MHRIFWYTSIVDFHTHERTHTRSLHSLATDVFSPDPTIRILTAMFSDKCGCLVTSPCRLIFSHFVTVHRTTYIYRNKIRNHASHVRYYNAALNEWWKCGHDGHRYWHSRISDANRTVTFSGKCGEGADLYHFAHREYRRDQSMSSSPIQYSRYRL